MGARIQKPLHVVIAILGLILIGGLAWATKGADAAMPASDVTSRLPLAAMPGGLNGQQGIIVGHSYHNDKTLPLRNLPQVPYGTQRAKSEREENLNPPTNIKHKDGADTVVQRFLAPLAMPTPILNFEGVDFPGVNCNCAPPDTDGEVGDTQYVQMVNQALQVFDKATGASQFGPVDIKTLWQGFGDVCEFAGHGDPVVLYDQIAGRWLISQFAALSNPTDECIAISASSDATDVYYRWL